MAKRSVYMAGAAKRASPLDARVLDRRIPRSSKYNAVTGRVNSGATVEKVPVLTARQYNQRRDEIFCRVTPAQLQELLAEYEGEAREDLTALAAAAPRSRGPRVVSYQDASEPSYERPYLILDVRSAQEFSLGHIVQARSFPAALLNQDRVTPDIQRFRNRQATLIIVYDNDGRTAVEAARRFIQRGFENIFVLTGGLAQFVADGFQASVEGQVPAGLPIPGASPPRDAGPHAFNRTTPARAGKPPSRATLSRRRRSSGSSAGESTPEMDRASRTSGRATRTFGSSSRMGAGLPSPEHRLTPRKLGCHNAAMQGKGAPGSASSAGVHRMRRMIQDSQGPESYAPSQGDAQSQVSNLSLAESIISRSTARRGRHV